MATLRVPLVRLTRVCFPGTHPLKSPTTDTRPTGWASGRTNVTRTSRSVGLRRIMTGPPALQRCIVGRPACAAASSRCAAAGEIVPRVQGRIVEPGPRPRVARCCVVVLTFDRDRQGRGGDRRPQPRAVAAGGDRADTPPANSTRTGRRCDTLGDGAPG